MAFDLKSEVPLEAAEGRSLMRWVRYAEAKYPELAAFYHIPNGGPRTPQTGAQMKRQGVKKGIPDYCLPVARNGYHALYIELKRIDSGALSEEQKDCILLLRKYHNKVVVVHGWERAKSAILKYLEVENE